MRQDSVIASGVTLPPEEAACPIGSRFAAYPHPPELVNQAGGGTVFRVILPEVSRSRAAGLELRGFRSDVQVLRGLAVLAVVLYHGGGLLPGGYVGVDMFFVISGFVIGRVLLAEVADRGTVSLSRFFARRIRRLLPALALVVTVTVALAPWLAPFESVRSAALTGLATMLFFSNGYLYWISQVGYFDPAMHLNPFLHMWSLSVEEQFYFAVPLLLVLTLALARGRRPFRAVAVLLAAVGAISLLLSVLLSYGMDFGPLNGPRFAFYAPVTRAWEFVLGFGLVLVPTRYLPSGRWRWPLVVFGVGGLLGSFALMDATTVFPGWIALVPALATVALIASWACDPARATGGIAARVLRVLEWLGDISYGWYLWHWPAIVFAGAYWVDRPWVALAAGFASLAPAWLSYRLVENPIRRRLTAAPAATLLLAAVCVLVPAGLAYRLQAQMPRGLYVGEAAPFSMHVDYRQRCDSRLPLGERPEGACVWEPTTGEAVHDVVLVGDSNAGHLSEGIIAAGNALGARVTIATATECAFVDIAGPTGVYRPGCRAYVTDALAHLERTRPDLVVIGMSEGYWNEATAQDIALGLERVAERLAAVGTTVAFLELVPKPIHSVDDWRPARYSRLALTHDFDASLFEPYVPGTHAGREGINAAFASATRRAGGVVWSFTDVICPGGTCVPTIDGDVVWRERGHLSIGMAELLIPQIEREMRMLFEDCTVDSHRPSGPRR